MNRKPKHYSSNIDPIDLIESQLTPDMVYGFYIGNVIKYAARAHRKDGKKDLAKAAHYIELTRQNPEIKKGV